MQIRSCYSFFRNMKETTSVCWHFSELYSNLKAVHTTSWLLIYRHWKYFFLTADHCCGAQQLWSTTRPGKAWALPCGSRRAQTTCWPCWKLTWCSKLLQTFPSNAKWSPRSIFHFIFTFQNSIFIRQDLQCYLIFKYLWWCQAKQIVSYVVFLWASQMKFHPLPLQPGGCRNLRGEYQKRDMWWKKLFG